MTLLTMMLLPFKMSKHTEFLTNNAISAMFNCAMKVCVIAFLSVVGMTTLGRYINTLKPVIMNISASNYISILLQMDITALVLVFLVWQMPKLVQGLLRRSPQLGAGQMVSMVASGATTVASIAGGLTAGAALGGAGAAGGGGGEAAAANGSKMSTLSKPDAAGVEAANMNPSTTPGTTGPSMSKMNSPSGGGTGGIDGGTTSSGGSGGGLKSTLGNAINAVGNVATHAAFNSAPAQAFRKGYNAVADPYGVGPLGKSQDATGKSWTSGHMTDASGNEVEGQSSNKTVTDSINIEHVTETTEHGATVGVNISGKKYTVTVNPTPTPPPVDQFDPKA